MDIKSAELTNIKSCLKYHSLSLRHFNIYATQTRA